MSRIATISCAFALIMAVQSTAQWSSNPYANNPICTEQRNQRLVRAISDGRGGMILTWEDERFLQNITEVFAQHVDANGNIRWGVNGAPVCTMPGSQNKPQITGDEKGGAFIVWKDNRFQHNDVYMQHIDSTGQMLWTADGIDLTPPIIKEKYQSDPVICSDSLGGVYVAFMDNVPGGNFDNQIMLVRVDSLGNFPWGGAGYVAPIVPQSGMYQYSPSICTDGANGAFVAWQWFLGGPSGQYDLYCQRVGPKGNLYWRGNGVGLCTVAGSQGYPFIDYDGLHGVVSAWADYRTSTVAIYTQRLDADGNAMWPGSKIHSHNAASDHPSIVGMDNGCAVVAWEDYRGGSTCDIYAQFLDKDGKEIWTKDGVPVCTAPGNQFTPYVIRDGMGGVIIVWEDRRDGNLNADIYAQRLDRNGNPLWQPNGVLVCGAKNMQNMPIAVADGNGGGMFAWEDYRADYTNGNIYAFKVLADGSYPKSQPALTLSSKSVSFGVVGVGSRRDRVVLLTNTGGDTLHIHSIRSDNPAFTPRPTSMVIASGASQNDSIRFTPSAVGPAIGHIILESDSWTSPDTITVTGEGTGTAALELEQRFIAFGYVKLGLRKDTVITFSNAGLDTLKITEIKSSNTAFTVSNPVVNILPGGTFRQTVTFAPRVPGNVNARLTITSNAPTSKDTLYVTGIGFGEVDILLTPANIAFGRVPVGTSRDTVIQIKNNGTDTLRVSEILSDNIAFRAIPDRFLVSPVSTYALTVRFSPSILGPNTGELTMYSNSTTSPDRIPVSGIGETDVSIAPEAINFGNVSIGEYKDTVFIITNHRTDTLRIADIVSDNPAYSARPVSVTIPPGRMFIDTLRFAPATIGAVNATISILSNAATSPTRLTVSGEGRMTSPTDLVPEALGFTLYKNYPNPFRPVTVIPYYLHRRGHVQLRVENTLGQTVAILVDEVQNPGWYRPAWNARDLPSGVYRSVLSLEGVETMGTMLLLK
ncbi:MAG: choice-of-anchor D domain-containing protein [Bacteroidota bacterium]|nr:choice-of-anchor D domain-containing protein [Bacteroidota bacterium]